MKKSIISILLILSAQIYAYSQEGTIANKSFFSNIKVDLSGTFSPPPKAIGFIIKGQKKVFNTQHFSGYLGISFQYSYLSETGLFLEEINGFSQDIGNYIISEWRYYPFKKKRFYTGLEPYLGVSNLKVKGSFELPEYNIKEHYQDEYSFFNYGLTIPIGYNFGNISTNLFIMSSLKGFIDNGRFRPGDPDSKIFLGLNIGYKIR